MSDDPLDGIPAFDRVSLRAVLVAADADPTEALNAAGIYDPVSVPVMFDDGSGQAEQGPSSGIPAVLEFQPSNRGLTQPEAMTTDSTAAADAAEGVPPSPATKMFPPGRFGQALAPVRPRR